MLENSIDAGSTSIEILVKDGGLKLLQITDNGSGILKEDLPILCERFTTSKITKFEDLSNINTYGFRGEALASISHIAHLTVTTKSKTSPCAWRQTYQNGKPLNKDPAPTAGKNGTIILVEDLFYNVPSRRKAFKSTSEEFGKILDVVGKYAIHCTNVAFSCKKHGDSHASLVISANATNNSKKKPEVDRIRQVYGSSIANELISVDIPPKPEYGFLGGQGQITSANYNDKKSIAPVFFINHRSVASNPLRRAIMQGVYSRHLSKGGHAFVYLSLEFDPRNLDVNVHPTKREVRFLYEEEIIDHVCASLQEVLVSQGSSRTFQTQSVFAPSGFASNSSVKGLETAKSGTNSEFTLSQKTEVKKPYEYKMVRTDATQEKLTSMFLEGDRRSALATRSSKEDSTEGDTYIVDYKDVQSHETENLNPPSSIADINYDTEAALYTKTPLETMDLRERTDVRLKSIRILKQRLEEHSNEQLTRVFSEHTFIGVVDHRRRLCTFQYGVKIYMVDYGQLCKHFFYQCVLAEFSNMGKITLQTQSRNNQSASTQIDGNTGISVKDILNENEVKNYPKSQLQKFLVMKEMLEEYFGLKVSVYPEKVIPNNSKTTKEDVPHDNKDNGGISNPTENLKNAPHQSTSPATKIRDTKELGDTSHGISEPNKDEEISEYRTFMNSRIETLPMIIKNFIPPISKLGLFLESMILNVNYDDELECFEGVAKELAKFYIPEPILEDDNDTEANEIRKLRRQEISNDLEHLIFPAIKHRFLAPEVMTKDVVEIANLPGLYKVFERC